MKRKILSSMVCCAGLAWGTAAQAALINPTLEKAITVFNSTGVMSYSAATTEMNIQASGLIIQFNGFEVLIPTSTVTIKAKINGSGSLIGGVAGDDLVLTGTIDYDDDGNPEYSGVLLTAEVNGFGYLDQGATDLYDFTFTSTGGQLAGIYGKAVGVTLTSENSTFLGSFSVDFGGGAKGVIGNIPGGLCARTPGYWKNHLSAWPVTSMTIGGVTYNQTQLIRLLEDSMPFTGQKNAKDPSVKLARALIAAKLDLLSGSGAIPELVAKMAESDALLAVYPPGSNAGGEAKGEILDHKDFLADYEERPPFGGC